MSKPVIRRYLSEEVLKAVTKDFKFLIDKVKALGFEYDLQIRDNFFNDCSHLHRGAYYVQKESLQHYNRQVAG